MAVVVVGIAEAKPKREPPPPAKLEDTCRDAGCKRRAMDHFTSALAKHRAGTAKQPLRISFFGDSLIATDHICDNLRTSLGKLVGNGGPGFVWAAEPHPYVQQ